MDTLEHNENASKGFMPNECIGIPRGQVVAEVYVCFTPHNCHTFQIWQKPTV